MGSAIHQQERDAADIARTPNRSRRQGPALAVLGVDSWRSIALYGTLDKSLDAAVAAEQNQPPAPQVAGSSRIRNIAQVSDRGEPVRHRDSATRRRCGRLHHADDAPAPMVNFRRPPPHDPTNSSR